MDEPKIVKLSAHSIITIEELFASAMQAASRREQEEGPIDTVNPVSVEKKTS